MPHICARFGPGGQLIKVIPNLPSEGQPALVEIHSMEVIPRGGVARRPSGCTRSAVCHLQLVCCCLRTQARETFISANLQSVDCFSSAWSSFPSWKSAFSESALGVGLGLVLSYVPFLSLSEFLTLGEDPVRAHFTADSGEWAEVPHDIGGLVRGAPLRALAGLFHHGYPGPASEPGGWVSLLKQSLKVTVVEQVAHTP